MSIKKTFHLSIPIDDEEIQESTSDWRDVIFLPFHPVWSAALLFSVLLNASLAVYDICYMNVETFKIALIYHICEFFYFTDIVLIVMHRNYPNIRKRRSHKYKGLGFIAINLVSMVPLWEITHYLSIPDFLVKEDTSRNYLKLKCIIRLFRVLEFGNEMTNKPGYHTAPISTVFYLVIQFMIGHFLSSIFYVVTYGEKDGWMKHLDKHKFDRNSSFQWYLLTFMLTSGNLLHNFPTLVNPELNKELLYYIWTLLLGFTLHMMVYVSNLISIFKKDNMNYFEFQTQVDKIVGLLNEWEVDDELKQKTVEYYKVFWQQRQGLKEMPEMFNLLPTSLKKEVTVDIFWEALRHSHFFAKTDMSFKRSVSLVMKSEFLLPGDFLFRVDELKTKMVYIVSGVVQILSNEDDDSPIMSFSGGTLLGETGCLIATVSPANLRTVTYCEIQTLYLIDLYKVLLEYPAIAIFIRQQLSNRLATARHETIGQREDQSSATMIKSIREFWNDLWHSSVRRVQVARPSRRAHRVRADNLDLLALSDDVELQVDSICLSGSCPFIMEPDTSFRRCCDIVVIFAVLVQVYIIPKAALYHNRLTEGEMSTLFLMDVIYYLDIYLQISTAEQKNNSLIADFRAIIVIRLKQLTFLVDVLATLPLDYVLFISSSSSFGVYFKLFRLLKVYKVIRILKHLESLFVVDMRIVTVIKYVFLYVCSIYWFTCVTHGVSAYDSTQTNWYVYTLQLFMNTSEGKNRFLSSLVVTVAAYMNYGPTGFFFYTLYDIWFYLVIILCGHILFSYGLCELIARAVSKYENERTSMTYLQALHNEASQYKIDASVHARVLNFLSFHYSVSEGCQISGEDSIFSSAPNELRNEIVRHRIIHCLKKVPLFADASDNLLRYIVTHSEIKLCPRGAILLKSENKSEILYVVMRGYCKMESNLPGDLERGSTAILQSGSTFPFLETFHNAFSFLQVTTITVAELLLIRTKIVMNAFQMYEADYGSFGQALQEHRRVYGSILFRKGARLTLMRSAKKAIKKGDVFEYDMYDVDDIQCSEEAYKLPFIKLGFWSGCRYLLMRKTIKPNSWFYTIWEIFRCVIALIYTLCALTMSTLVAHMLTRVALRILFSLLDLICFVDMYLRLHCQYYTDKGILVTHPLFTARHYLRTSFIIDAISFMPIENLQLDEYFGRRHRNGVMICSMLFTRLLLLHRPLSGLTYLEAKYKGKRCLAVHMVKYLVLIVTAIAFWQTIQMLLLCQIEDIKLYCTKGNYTADYDYVGTFTRYFYRISMMFTVASTGDIIESAYRGKIMLVCLVPMFVLRWTFMISITSKAIGGNIELTLYRDRMKSYMAFLKGAAVSVADTRSIADHYEYVWKKSHGMNMHHVLKYFHPQLEQDMAFNLYSTTMLRASLFQGEHFSLFQALTPLFHREYYTKDSNIIQCNDVQRKIFFVHEGSVGIYIANSQVCVLEIGGMFGCFDKMGITRQTLTAIAKIHSTVLTVDSTLFYKTLQSFPRAMERLTRANSFNYEYMKETLKVVRTSSTETNMSSHGLYDSYKPYFDKIYFMEDGPRYTTLNYLVSVHLYPLGSMFVLGASFVNLQHAQLPEVLGIIYTLDVIHLAMMILKLNKMYLDPVSGRLVRDPYVIRKSYARTTFWLDFLTIIPFDIMSQSFTPNAFVHNLCRLNRSARFIALVIYYYQCEERLTMKKHLKWTYMIYSNLFLIELFACGWLLVACPESKCKYNAKRVSFSELAVVRENDTFSSVLLAYLFIVNMYTGSCSIKSSPIFVKEIIVACIIALITQYITTNLCSAYTSMVLVDQFNFSRYEVRHNRLSTYLQARNLSPLLYSKVTSYCLRLWQWQRGDWLPEMIKECPSSLKQNIMQLLYGKNLSNHFLFHDTHKDFLRQLVAHLERFVFTPGESIVETGDSDCSMYFINKGEVNVLEITGKTEKKMVQLTSGMSFGEVQGLFCKSHQYSYRAGTVCEILVLKKDNWNYLLKWFPASLEEIKAKARLHNLGEDTDVVEGNDLL
ncbi:hypothetical protein Trydic_g8587 [Trypoxylus dichotomus]